jgi:uncharacterized protein YecE (DUF72 family)
MGDLFIGTSGYTYKDWRGIFYPKGVPQKEWLAFYAQHYNTVEINATFYRPFPQKVYERWRESTPPEFRFTLKGPRTITHQKKLRHMADDLQSFVENSSSLGEKLDAMLWQFPPSAKAGDLYDELNTFLSQLPTAVRQVFEFRHTSWFNDGIYRLLNQYHAGFVINDSSRFPAKEVTTGDLMYVRFHGPKKLYASLYSLEELEKWAAKIKPHLNNHDVYIYFNNDFGGRALQNANELRDLLTH